MGVFRLVSRHGTKIIPLAALTGLMAQDLATLLRPYLGSFVVVMLTVSLLRVNYPAFLARLRRPRSALAAALWTTVVMPLAILGAATLAGPPFDAPIWLAVAFLFVAPPPIVSAPAFAMLIGLDGAMVLAVMLISTVAMPLTAPWIASLFVADVLPIGAADLALRLALMIGASFAVAAVLRRTLGARRIEGGKTVFDTISVAIAILFAIGAMDGVGLRLVNDTAFTLVAMAGSFAFALAQIALTYALFRPFVGADAVAIAYAPASRNAGLVVAALGVTAVDETVWLFFALSQLPIFFIPLAVQVIGHRITPRTVAGRKAEGTAP